MKEGGLVLLFFFSSRSTKFRLLLSPPPQHTWWGASRRGTVSCQVSQSLPGVSIPEGDNGMGRKKRRKPRRWRAWGWLRVVWRVPYVVYCTAGAAARWARLSQGGHMRRSAPGKTGPQQSVAGHHAADGQTRKPLVQKMAKLRRHPARLGPHLQLLLQRLNKRIPAPRSVLALFS